MKRIILLCMLLTGVSTLFSDSMGGSSPKTVEYVREQYLRDIETYYDSPVVRCTDKNLLLRFEEIKKRLNIKEDVFLFESQQMPPCWSAYYDIHYKIVCIKQPYFNSKSKAVQDFILYHELRHHIQFTQHSKTSSYFHVKYLLFYYMKFLKLSRLQALEYDADMFALKAAPRCPYCLQEIQEERENNWIDKYNKNGYITQKAVYPFLKKALKNPRYCDQHKFAITIT